MNLFQLTFPLGTELKINLGDYPDTQPGAAQLVADAISEAIKTELGLQSTGLVEPLNARIKQLSGEVLNARGILVDHIIAMKTLSGSLKAEDEDKIKAERAYLMGGEADDDNGLSTTRLVAEFNQVLSLGSMKPGQAANNRDVDDPVKPTGNPFYQTAAPIMQAKQGAAARPA